MTVTAESSEQSLLVRAIARGEAGVREARAVEAMQRRLAHAERVLRWVAVYGSGEAARRAMICYTGVEDDEDGGV